MLGVTGLTRKKKAGTWLPLPSAIQDEWLGIDDQKIMF